MEALLSECPFPTLAAVPAGHELRSLVPFLRALSREHIDRRAPINMSQKIVQLLYKTTTQLGRDVYAAFLIEMCEEHADLKREVANWFIYAVDDVSQILTRWYPSRILI